MDRFVTRRADLRVEHSGGVAVGGDAAPPRISVRAISFDARKNRAAG